MLSLAYLCDSFEQFNKLNFQIQSKNTDIIKFVDALRAFVLKLLNLKRKVRIQNCLMFDKLDILLDNRGNKLPAQIENGILEHLSTLENEFERYFSEMTNDELDFVRNSFPFSVEKLSDECQDGFWEMVNDFSARQAYHEKLLTRIWIEKKDSYFKTTENALRILIPFMSTYLCEAEFFTLLQIKTKQRNRLDIEDDLRCNLSHSTPDSKLLAFSTF